MRNFISVFLLSISAVFLTAAEMPDVDSLDKRIEAAGESATAENEIALPLLRELRQVRGSIDELEKSKSNYEVLIKQLPKELAKAEEKLATQNDTRLDAKINPSNLETHKLEQELNELQLQQAKNDSVLTELTQEFKQRSQRTEEIPGQLTTEQEELSKITLPSKPGAGAPEEEQLRYQIRLSRQALHKAQTEELILEQQYLNESSELHKLRYQFAAAQNEKLKAQIKDWQQILSQKKSSETRAVEKETKDQQRRYADAPELAEISNRNAVLARQISEVLEQVGATNRSMDALREEREKIREQYRNARERVSLFSRARLRIDPRTAALLHDQRALLPSLPELKAKQTTISRDATSSQIQTLELDKELLAQARNIDSELKELARKFPQFAQSQIEELLRRHRSLLIQARQEQQKLTSTLLDSYRLTAQVQSETEQYSHYLDRHLLWIPSANPLSLNDAKAEFASFHRKLWQPLRHALPNWSSQLRGNPFTWGVFLILFVSLLLLQARSKQRLTELQLLASPRNCTSIHPTLNGILHSLSLALPLPLLFAFLAWITQPLAAWSAGLQVIALFLFLTILLYRLCSPAGILHGHFRFAAEKMQLLRRQLRWFIPLAVPFVFLSTALPINSEIPEAGRLSLLISLSISTLFFHSLLRPGAQFLYNSEKPHSRLPKIIHLCAISLPLILIIGASFGYLSSAFSVRKNLIFTLWLLLLIGFIARFFLRWILVSRRRLARAHARERYRARLNAANTEKGETSDSLPSLEEIEANAIDPIVVEEQTSRLVRISSLIIAILGLWSIWSPMFPALSVLDDVVLYGESETTDRAPSLLWAESDSATTESAAPAVPESESVEEDSASISRTLSRRGITLKDFLSVLLIIIITISAARNLPGLLELAVLQHLSLRPGSNYAITTLLRYIITLLGLIFAFGQLGITWSKIQWLAAAISLGVGFGLQEIIANFVAGIILLFERPIRIGDVITMGDISGRISKIQIRATTIRQFNQRELIVPNKEFITGRFVNWTLNDELLGFEIRVGVAHGSDTAQVIPLLEKLLSEHPAVLKNPAPSVILDNITDKALVFALFGTVAKLSDLAKTRSSLWQEIHRAFHQENIRIAIPRREVQEHPTEPK